MAWLSRLESSIQRDIIKWLDTIPDLFHFKTIACNRRGIADVIIVYKGRPIFFEIKQGGKKLGALQEHQRDKVLNAGGAHYTIHSLAEAKAALAEAVGESVAGAQ